MSNRFQKRRLEKRRVLSPSLRNDEIAYWDPETNQVEVTKLIGLDQKFATPYHQKSPTFSDLYNLEPGSAEERNYLDTRMRQGLPRYQDPKTGTVLG